jgi:uncharacterized protein
MPISALRLGLARQHRLPPNQRAEVPPCAADSAGNRLWNVSAVVILFRAMKTIVLLVFSNIFMTIAWYWHLKYRTTPLLVAIGVSWMIALPEYCFQVPANRIGYGEFTAYQLKIIQEIITLIVFVVFAYFYLGEGIKWNYAVSFGFLLGAVLFAFWGQL